jgi:hypothetical protein
MSIALEHLVKQTKRRFSPFSAFVLLSVVVGILGAWLGWPALGHTLTGLDLEWGWNARAWFFGASIALVAFGFAAFNLLLRLLDREALNISVPSDRFGPVRVLGWPGLIPIAIGVVIGKTIFT